MSRLPPIRMSRSLVKPSCCSYKPFTESHKRNLTMKRILFALLLAPLVALQAADTTKPRPNIILFLIDDLGWKDLGCQGSTFYQTPNIDRLAREGVRFTEAYAACAVCSPTRAAILTGKYPARLRFTHIMGGEQPSPSRKLKTAGWIQNLPLEEVTFAEALKAAGYATGHFGKWHVGGPDFGPDKQGFDVTMDATPAKNHQDKNVTQLTDAAIAFMRAHAKEPFLTSVCHHTVHVPYEADEALTTTYRAKAPATGQNHPKMAAMIETLDQSVRRVLQTLDELSLAEKTIIILTSDNGGLRSVREGKKTVTATDNSPARGGKAMLYEGGTRVPLIIKWPGVTPTGGTSAVPVISMDLYPTLLDMAGLPARPSQHRDGLSLAPLLKGTGTLDRDALQWHFPHYHSNVATPMGSLRAGDWKLIEFFEDNRIELYNLKNDIGEKQNLAAKEPEKAAELRKKLQDWRAEVNAAMPIQKPDLRSIHETFETPFDAMRFLTPIPNKNTEVRDGVLWTRGSSGGKYPPMVYLPVQGRDLTISFRYRHLAAGGMLWFFVDGDDGFGSEDHMLRVKLLRDGVQLQIDAHSKDANHPMRQNTDRPADPKSGAYRLNEILPLEKVDLTANAWREVKLVFHGEEVIITLDGTTWAKTLKRANFNAAKRKLLWMQNGGNQGIELDDIHVTPTITQH